MGTQKQVRAAARARDRKRETRIGLLVNELVVFAPHQMAIKPVGALGAVLPDVEQRAVIARPRDRAHFLDAVGEHPAIAQVLQMHRVFAESAGIRRIGEQVAVGADFDRSHGVELVALRQAVHVQDHGLGRVRAALPAAETAVLLAFLGPGVIVVGTLAVRDFGVGFLDAREHLLVQLLLQTLRGLHHRRCVRILGAQIGAYRSAGLVAQPMVTVDAALPVHDRDVRYALG